MAPLLASLTSTQKLLIAGGAGGLGLILLFGRKKQAAGGGDQGIAVVDVRRPTDDMNTPGAQWGAGNTMVEITRAYTDLMGRLIPPTGNSVTSQPPPPTVIPVPIPPANPPTPKPVQKGTRTYVTQPGDSLHSIAGSQLSDPNLWGMLGSANRGRLDYENLADWRDRNDNLMVPARKLKPGTQLILPSTR